MDFSGFMGGGGGYSLDTSSALGFNTGPTNIQTGATFNFAKPASATGVSLDFNVGWLLLGAVVVGGIVLAKIKGGA
ncbi:hypothetical protein C3942_16885 [Solimonas fluminis]|uniref:Uncharacterized protein n=1 Tax=Solimonas fluminis TaxID=2086571 RepID=A0A2S5TCJ0_9GAMM|nr:hypothetical protein [Solimonas fluminis]PPE72724.1 hypothetical protein C3942_16885 [Solimonas fluminis]